MRPVQSMMSPLTPEELTRYSRHLLLPEVGLEGQQRLKQGSVLIVGTGGLGSPAALYLAAAGVGRIGLVDFDDVAPTNLQRQVLFGSSDVGASKVRRARARLADLNPHIELVIHQERLTSQNALTIIGNYDLVLDGSDNFPTRYLVNDACVLAGKPLAFGSIYRFEGQVSLFHYQGGPCYRCIFPKPPPPHLVPSCAEGGVLGVLPGVIGSLQATEVLKVLLGKGRTLSGRLLLYDALNLDFRTVRLEPDPRCPVCGDKPTVTELIDYEQFCAPGRSNAQAMAPWQGPQAAEPCSSPVTAAEGRTPPGSSEDPIRQVRPLSVSRLADLLKGKQQTGKPPAIGTPKDPWVVQGTEVELTKEAPEKEHDEEAEPGKDMRVERPQLLDVRLPAERTLCGLPGALLIPLAQLPQRLEELDRGRPVVVFCHVGRRSRLAAELLLREGFERVYDLAGGLDEWARQVDPAMVRY